jgi:hypothetical protein
MEHGMLEWNIIEWNMTLTTFYTRFQTKSAPGVACTSREESAASLGMGAASPTVNSGTCALASVNVISAFSTSPSLGFAFTLSASWAGKTPDPGLLEGSGTEVEPPGGR